MAVSLGDPLSRIQLHVRPGEKLLVEYRESALGYEKVARVVTSPWRVSVLLRSSLPVEFRRNVSREGEHHDADLKRRSA